MDRTLKIVVAVLAAPALILCAIALYLFLGAQSFAASATRTEGTVTELVYRATPGHARTAAPIVQFTAAGRSINLRSNAWSSSPSYRVGDKVTVLYRPDAPDDARIDAFQDQYLGATICGGIGVSLGLSAGLVAFIVIRGRKRRERALTYGTPVRAKVVAVRPNTNVRVNGRNPWLIEAEHTDQALSRTFKFTSPSMWDDPSARFPAGAEVTVYYIEAEPHVYAFVLDDGAASAAPRA